MAISAFKTFVDGALRGIVAIFRLDLLMAFFAQAVDIRHGLVALGCRVPPGDLGAGNDAADSLMTVAARNGWRGQIDRL